MAARIASAARGAAGAPPDRQRRRLLLRSAAVAGACSLGLPALRAATGAAGTDVDVHIELHALPDRVALRPGPPTGVWRYRARLLHGEPSALGDCGGPLQRPVIRVRRGQRIRIDLLNGLPEPTIVHWHGLHVPDDMDGHPRFAIGPGERYVYEFDVDNRAGSYWFHPHPHGRTGKQVWYGLAGLFLVADDDEAALDLPRGAHDLPLVLQDRSFDADNQFAYPGAGRVGSPHQDADAMPAMGGGMGSMMGGGMMGRAGMASMRARMMGLLGDQLLVNGQPQARLDVERRPHRLRLLNASNTRTLKLGWSDGSPLTVIGSDGGLLAVPLQRDYVVLAPAERADLWVDFGRWSAGDERSLRSLPFDSGMRMMRGMMGGDAPPDGAAMPVATFRARDGDAATGTLPQRLSVLPAPDPARAVNAERPKPFDLTMRHMAWGINGQSFEMLEASELETVKLGTQEIWEFRNDGSGSMMRMLMPHAMHVHGLQFRVVGRTVDERFAAARRSVEGGLLDEGWKDTVLVMPGERVRVLLGFEDHPGLFLYHCHMLEHEDSGLMRNYRVVA